MSKVSKYQPVYPMINTIEELEKCDKSGIYSTLNFDMFEKLEFNRGEDNGIDPNKMREFETILAEGKYNHEGVQMMVNVHRVIIDGTHKNELHRRHYIPINFYFTQIPALNSTDPVILYEGVANYNAVNSKWNSQAHFRTALKLQLPLALEIEQIQAECQKEYGIDGRTLSPNRVYALLSHDKHRLDSNMVTVKDYNNKDLLGVKDTPKFKREMNFVCTILKELEEWNKVYEETAKFTTFHMVRGVMPFVWDEMINMEIFIDEIQAVEFKKRFKNIANTVKGCTAFVRKTQQRIINNAK